MADSEEPNGLPRKPRRRWLQVSLRTLLILVTLLGIWLGWVVNRGERQRRAVAAIREIGGIVYYEHDVVVDRGAVFVQLAKPISTTRSKSIPTTRSGWRGWFPWDCFENVHSVQFPGDKVADADLAHLQALKGLHELHIMKAPVTDAGLKHLRGLTTLKSLDLVGTQASDAGLENLAGLTSLTHLNLHTSGVTDAGLVHLKKLTQLTELCLSHTRVTGDGLKHLRGTASLREVLLDSSPVTDAGLPHLESLTNLQYLSLRFTQVTDSGLRKLRWALPKCQVYGREWRDWGLTGDDEAGVSVP